ncbi:MAG: SDR family NAD(P)-dependent oxidoreductase [Hyphomonas sp.]|nr:SDR family NAD(P)-dependent oxidoreductase [Hyphomonas sp.]
MTDPSQPLFLFGPGYSAQALAALWRGPVLGTYRSDERREMLEQSGIQPVSVDGEADLRKAMDAAHVVISAPPSEDGCPGFARLAGFADTATSLTYLSTTGTYGDLNGGWAMEWSRPNPQSDRAQRRLAAEQAWQGVSDNLCIVRLPGIYGLGRSAFDRLASGRARRIVKDGQVFSRAHVDDIASGLDALVQSGARGVFNLCDDLAAPPEDVISFAAALAGINPPPAVRFEDAELSVMGRSFYSECKRVSNARLKAVTGWRPRYPTYRDGLSAIFAAAG